MNKILIILILVSCFTLIMFTSVRVFSQVQKTIPHSQYNYERQIHYRIGCYLCVNYATKKYRYIIFRGNDTKNLRKKAGAKFNCKIIDVWSRCPVLRR